MSDLFGQPLAAGDALDPGDRALVDAYAAAARTLDDLPYTPEFERVYEAAGGDLAWGSRREAFHRLHNLRKAKRLPTLGRSPSPPIKVTEPDESLLTRLVLARVATLGQRDQLLYDPRFDDLVAEFNAATSRSLSPHDLWRLVAKLAK